MKIKAVGYTRVSSAGQQDNASLDKQESGILQTAQELNAELVCMFGKGVESGVNLDERIEFRRMLDFVLDKDNGIRYILVANWSRFSRDGLTAIAAVLAKLAKRKIEVIAFNQQRGLCPIYDQYRDGIAILKSGLQYTETKRLRREGQVKHLKAGLSVSKPPIGYRTSDTAGLYVPDARSGLVKEAFELKDQGLSNRRILARLEMLGYFIEEQQLKRLLKNPYYCGFIQHSLLEDELVKGQHTPLVTEDLFYRVNDCKCKTRRPKRTVNPNTFPLMGTLKHCNKAVTTSPNHNKGIGYYRCNICGEYFNATHVNDAFVRLLRGYSLLMARQMHMETALRNTYRAMRCKELTQLNELTQKHKQLDRQAGSVMEKYDLGEIDQVRYQRALRVILQRQQRLNRCISILEKTTAALQHYMDFALRILSDPLGSWVEGDQNGKNVVASIVFPGGIIYDKSGRTCKPIRVSDVFCKTLNHPATAFCTPCNGIVVRKAALSKMTYTDLVRFVGCLEYCNEVPVEVQLKPYYTVTDTQHQPKRDWCAS